MYTKEMYIAEIKSWIKKHGYDAERIGNITFDIHLRYINKVDRKLYDALIYIASMEGGPEFELTEEEFYDYLNHM